MSYNCEILADSKNPQGDRITTMKITFPRFILAEFNTHRMFSRNSASSRAIPFRKMVKMVQENPFVPIAWQKDHKGMQGVHYITDVNDIYDAEAEWLQARDFAVGSAKGLNEDEPAITKQLCNRLLEPFMWHTVIVTSTEWENFFKLRCPQYQFQGTDKVFRSKKDANKHYPENSAKEQGYLYWMETLNKSQAEIHIQEIAEMMWDAYNESTPKELERGQWHIPYGDNIELPSTIPVPEGLTLEQGIDLMKVKIAVARCARISYETLGDNPKIDYEADIKLHDRLIEMEHSSPLEHVARCMSPLEYRNTRREIFVTNGEKCKTRFSNGWSRNFKGFVQYREIVESKLDRH